VAVLDFQTSTRPLIGAYHNGRVTTAPRIVLDRPILLTARSVYASPANPFERENFATPLRVLLHTASLAQLAGREREEAELLVSLGHSPFADNWLTWGEHDFGEGISHARLGAGLRDNEDTLAIEVSYDGGGSLLRTVLVDWWQWPQRADERYDGVERDRALDAYAGARLTAAADRHLFVCAEPTLLAERGLPPWEDLNVVTVREALAVVGLLMRQRGRCDLFYDDTGPFERSEAGLFHLQLTAVLANSAHQLFDALEAAGRVGEGSYDLLLSVENRINDLLVARDEVRVASLLPHGGAMLAGALYHLRAATQTALALLESVAVIAAEHLNVDRDRHTVVFRRSDFRKALADAGGNDLSAIVDGQSYLALSYFVSEVRGAVGHGGGLHGVTDPTASVVTSRVRLSDDQAEKLKQLYGQRGETAEEWGMHKGSFASVDADVFCDKLVRTTIEAFHETAAALECDVRRPCPGDSSLIRAWRKGIERAEEARARMPANERAELERREADQQSADIRYERDVLQHLALYGGLADWQLLDQMIAAHTQAEGSSARTA